MKTPHLQMRGFRSLLLCRLHESLLDECHCCQILLTFDGQTDDCQEIWLDAGRDFVDAHLADIREHPLFCTPRRQQIILLGEYLPGNFMVDSSVFGELVIQADHQLREFVDSTPTLPAPDGNAIVSPQAKRRADQADQTSIHCRQEYDSLEFIRHETQYHQADKKDRHSGSCTPKRRSVLEVMALPKGGQLSRPFIANQDSRHAPYSFRAS
ncbi:hypothetical protein TM7_0094 [candidate division TM7 genomosp. GTL1]|nr:hypothetical protein TM7_0094 [candidate division TM7 genomosp. GTL1]